MKPTLAVLALTGGVNAFDLFGDRSCVASCYFDAIDKAGCGNNPASCYCTDIPSKKQRQVAGALATCALTQCGTGVLLEFEEFTNNLCRPERTRSTCGPKNNCSSGQTCKAFSTRRKHCAIKKTPCQFESDCAYRNGERCLQGRCYAAVGGMELDDPCSDIDCGDKLVCDSGRCKSVAPCEVSNDCAGSLKCFSKTCRGPGLEGEECLGTLDCDGALVCTNGKCDYRKYKPPGAPCSSFIECGSADCTMDGVCGEFFDGKCTNDVDCGTGEWCYDIPGGTRCCPMNTPSNDPCRSR